MATYRQIHTHIWDDPRFEMLSPHAKLLFIYGFSNKHRNEAGLYMITVRKMAFETGLSIEETEAAIKEIENAGMWRYDRDNQVLWVKNALKYQSISVKSLVAIRRDLETVRSPLVDEFKEYYKEVLYPSDTLSTGYSNGTDTVSIPHSTPTDTLADKGKDKGKDITSEGSISSPDVEDIDPSDGRSSTKSKIRKYDEEDHKLVDFLKAYREQNGAPPTERDWHLRQLAIVHKLRQKYSSDELMQCFLDAQQDSFWSTQLDSWATIERYLPKWRLRRTARDRPKLIPGIPFEPSIPPKAGEPP